MQLPALLQDFIRTQQPRLGEIRVDGRRIYILPTRYGILFAVLVLVLLIGSINYGNNPIFLLTFVLAGVGMVAMQATWRNLRGVSVRVSAPTAVFAGEQAEMRLVLDESDGLRRPALQVHSAVDGVVLDLVSGQARIARVRLPAHARGVVPVPRLTLSTHFPMGLFRAWCYLQTDLEYLVYPKPVARWQALGAPAYGGAEDGGRGVGSGDFQALRPYRPGDTPSHLYWKAMASGRGLHTKVFGGDRSEQLWLDIDDAGPGDTELRLARLCRALLDAERRGQAYALKLRELELPSGQGTDHRRLCLEALARYPRGEAPEWV